MFNSLIANGPHAYYLQKNNEEDSNDILFRFCLDEKKNNCVIFQTIL